MGCREEDLVFEYMFEYHEAMQTPFQPQPFPDLPARGGSVRPAREAGSTVHPTGLMKAMSPGVVDYLFRQLVSGRPAEDVQWEEEGISLSAQPAGAELARRLAEIDVEALTPHELFHYVRAAQRLAVWAESLREAAVGRYCQPAIQHQATQNQSRQDPGTPATGMQSSRSLKHGLQD